MSRKLATPAATPLAQPSQAAGASLQLDEVLDRILSHVRAVVNCDSASIILRQDGLPDREARARGLPCAVRQRQIITLVNERIGHAGGEFLLVLPAYVEQFAELRKVALFEASFHFKCHRLDGMQGLNHIRVTLFG